LHGEESRKMVRFSTFNEKNYTDRQIYFFGRITEKKVVISFFRLGYHYTAHLWRYLCLFVWQFKVSFFWARMVYVTGQKINDALIKYWMEDEKHKT
jgi:hypothetical protein